MKFIVFAVEEANSDTPEKVRHKYILGNATCKRARGVVSDMRK